MYAWLVVPIVDSKCCVTVLYVSVHFSAVAGYQIKKNLFYAKGKETELTRSQ